MQRGVPDRAAGWLAKAKRAANWFPDEQSRFLAIQGMLASDTARYGDAVTALGESMRLAAEAGNRRQQAFGEALLGQVHLIRGELGRAGACLDRALAGVAAEHWTAFEPFVAGLRGETYLAAGRLEEASALIDRAWVMAELAGDHCYLALAAPCGTRRSGRCGVGAVAGQANRQHPVFAGWVARHRIGWRDGSRGEGQAGSRERRRAVALRMRYQLWPL